MKEISTQGYYLQSVRLATPANVVIGTLGISLSFILLAWIIAYFSKTALVGDVNTLRILAAHKLINGSRESSIILLLSCRTIGNIHAIY